MALVQVMNNQQIDQMQQAALPVVYTQPAVVDDLVSYLKTCWEKAYSTNRTAHTRMEELLRQYNSEYDPSKLTEIRKLGGSENFLPLTATKCNATIAWINEILITETPWSINATPVPQLPIDIENEVAESVLMEAQQLIMQYSMMSGKDPAMLVKELMPDIHKRIQNKLSERAEQGVENLSREMDDQLIEGGWYAALNDISFDLVVLKAACIKGPMLMRQKVFQRQPDQMSGRYTNSITEEIIPTFKRISPFNLFPSPNSTGVQDGYLFERDYTSPKTLQGLLGVPGYKDDAIRSILVEYEGGSLIDWSTYPQGAVQALTKNPQTSAWEADTIEMLIYNGAIKGSWLLEWGLTPQEVPDKDIWYESCVWVIGGKAIKAMVNPDPMGNRPYSVTSYINRPGSFWGDSLAEAISELQKICNAMVRSLVNNAGIASGPLVEWSKDRMENPNDKGLWPWRVIETNDQNMSGTPAVRFYQPNIIVDEVLKILDYFSKLADQYSVPAYAHGDTNVGGAGNTASGLSMLMTSSNRVIKNVMKNIDRLIEDSITKLFMHNTVFEEVDDLAMIGDVKIVAKGTSGMYQKEQQAVRRNEFLQATNNPADLQIIGLGGRKELLLQTAKALDIDNLSKVFPYIDKIDELKQEIEMQVAQMQQQAMLMEEEGEEEEDEEEPNGASKAPKGAPKAKKGKTLDKAGNSASGQDNRTFKQQNVVQMRANMGQGANMMGGGMM